jgi:hypothetical protein
VSAWGARLGSAVAARVWGSASPCGRVALCGGSCCGRFADSGCWPFSGVASAGRVASSGWVADSGRCVRASGGVSVSVGGVSGLEPGVLAGLSAGRRERVALASASSFFWASLRGSFWFSSFWTWSFKTSWAWATSDCTWGGPRCSGGRFMTLLTSRCDCSGLLGAVVGGGREGAGGEVCGCLPSFAVVCGCWPEPDGDGVCGGLLEPEAGVSWVVGCGIGCCGSALCWVEEGGGELFCREGAGGFPGAGFSAEVGCCGDAGCCGDEEAGGFAGAGCCGVDCCGAVAGCVGG